MVVFILVLLLTIGGIAGLAILMKRKESRIPLGGFGIAVLTIAFSVNLVSALYHQLGNEVEYEKFLSEREEITRAMEEAISASDAEAYAISAQDARIFNANLESEARASESIWIGVYSFDYATAHFEELYISIPDIPSF